MSHEKWPCGLEDREHRRGIFRDVASFFPARRTRSCDCCVDARRHAGIGSALNPGVMKLPSLRSSALWAAGGVGLLGAGYLALTAAAWSRYGHVQAPPRDEADDLLDRFMPLYEVVERHQIVVAAPAAVTLLAAKNGNLDESAIVRGIFKARSLLLGAATPATDPSGTLMTRMSALGWGVLADVPDREVIVGAVTQPWLPNVVFRAIPPEEFRDFREPGYVKIVWTLRADSIDANSSLFRTETRVVTTDAKARGKFRWYWARFSPGIALIRRVMVQSVKRDAERVALAAAS